MNFSQAYAFDPFFKNVEKKMSENPSLAAKICEKRIQYEVLQLRSREQISLRQKMNPQSTKFLIDFISLCTDDISFQNRISKELKENIKSVLFLLVEKILKYQLNEFEVALKKSLNYIFTDLTVSKFNTLKNKLQKILYEVNSIVGMNPNQDFALYIIEKFNSYGDFNASKNTINNLKKKNSTQSDYITSLNLVLARTFLIEGKYSQSEQLYIGAIESQKLTTSQDIITKIEISMLYRELGNIEKSEKFIQSAEAGLNSNKFESLYGWFYLEKSQLMFEKNKKINDDVSKYLSRSEFYYNKYGEQDLLFLHLKKSEFFRKLKKYDNAKYELDKASEYLSHYEGQPFYLFYFYYEQSILNFLNSSTSDLSKSIEELKKVTRFSSNNRKYYLLVAPLLSKKKGEIEKMRKQLSEGKHFFKDYFRKKEIDKLLN